LDPPLWRLVRGGDEERLVVTATQGWGLPALPIRMVWSIWTRLVFEGEVSANAGGSVIAGLISVRTPWWAVALLAAPPVTLFGVVVPLLLGWDAPAWMMGGLIVGAAAAALTVRFDQERALGAEPAISWAIREAAAGRFPAAPVAKWGPRA
jgi:hypothetical protein